MNVLVTTASRYGATAEIGDAIGRTLEARGIAADVAAIENVAELTDYDAVVIGSGVYMGRWLEPARTFVEAHADDLAERPTWLFSSGPIGDPPKPGVDDAVDVTAQVETSHARDHHVFTGRLERDGLHLCDRIGVAVVRAPDGDYRDWQDVESWARSIADELSDVVVRG